jgi:hypothetical protein
MAWVHDLKKNEIQEAPIRDLDFFLFEGRQRLPTEESVPD